jgi:hypothetical protein
MDVNARARKIIHEALHVSGQTEEMDDATVGPDDPPDSNAVDLLVRKACGL